MNTFRPFVFAAVLSVGLLAFPGQAEAGRGWSFGTSFWIGGVSFEVGFHEHSPHDYFWRTPVDLGRTYYGRAHRSSSCPIRDGYHYHGRDCPLIGDFFDRHGHDHHVVFEAYLPRRAYGSYDRPYRYDRFDRYNTYDRYDSRDRYDTSYRSRGARGRRSCPYR